MTSRPSTAGHASRRDLPRPWVRRIAILTVAATAAILSTCSAKRGESSERGSGPNIIVILAGDYSRQPLRGFHPARHQPRGDQGNAVDRRHGGRGGGGLLPAQPRRTDHQPRDAARRRLYAEFLPAGNHGHRRIVAQRVEQRGHPRGKRRDAGFASSVRCWAKSTSRTSSSIPTTAAAVSSIPATAASTIPLPQAVLADGVSLPSLASSPAPPPLASG